MIMLLMAVSLGALAQVPEAEAATSAINGNALLDFLTNGAVRAVLVMLILGGLVLEMHAPGTAIAGAIALVAALLYFLPMFIGGEMDTWAVVALVAGMVLLLLEFFVIPGFGFCGIVGIVLVTYSLIAAIVDGGAANQIWKAMLTVGSGAVLAVVAVLYLTSRHAPKWVRRHSELVTELSNKDGFIGVDMTPAKLVGSQGVSATVLRPAGKITIDGQQYDAVSTGEFIPPKRKVKVVKYENAQLYVVEDN